jgi:hypothetical protein
MLSLAAMKAASIRSRNDDWAGILPLLYVCYRIHADGIMLQSGIEETSMHAETSIIVLLDERYCM